MAKLGKKLGKLSLAILENFVEGKLGKKFVDELRAPTDRAIAIDTALENTEKRFTAECDDRIFAEKMFTGERIGKNLKYGNEIENSYRIAKIVPVLLKNG